MGGVLGLGLLIFVSLLATLKRFGEQALSILVIAASGSALVWGWLGPHLGDIGASILSRGLSFLWIAFCLISGERRRWSAPPAVALAVWGLAIATIFIDRDRVFLLLSYGYDNNAHIPAFAHTLRHQGFLFSGSLPDNFTNSILINGYPPLQASVWALVASAAGVQLRGGYEILNYFLFFTFLSGFLLSRLVVLIWLGKPGEHPGKRVNTLTQVLCWVLVSFSQISFVFWMGFPSFVFGCLIVLATLAWCQSLENHIGRFLVVLVGLTLLNYSYPLLSPALALTAFGLLLVKRHLIMEAARDHRATALLVTSLTISANYPIIKKTLALSGNLDAAGGIQPIGIWFLCSLVVVCVIAYLSIPSKPDIDIALVLAFVGSLVSFMILAIQSKLDRGNISYYPQKSGYLLLLLSFVMIGRLEVIHNLKFSSSFKRFLQVFTPVAVSVLLASTFLTRTTSGVRYHAPSTLRVLNDVWTGERSASVSCLQEAMRATEDVQYLNDSEVFLFMVDDLSTRWTNAVRGRLSDATYSLAIPLDDDMDIARHISDWRSRYPTLSLIILHGDDDTKLTEYLESISGPYVSLRRLACLS